MPKGQLSRDLAREVLDAVHFPGCPTGTSAASQTFLLTVASYSHSTGTSLQSICFMNPFYSFKVYFRSKRIFSKYCEATSNHRNDTLKGS